MTFKLPFSAIPIDLVIIMLHGDLDPFIQASLKQGV